jgi:hypothetical protein
MFSHFFLSLSVRLILRACTSLARYAVFLQFSPLWHTKLHFHHFFILFLSLFCHSFSPYTTKRVPHPYSSNFASFMNFSGGETSPEYGIDSSSCYFLQNINIFHMSFQFFALCKCRSCSISIVILVCSIQNRVEFYLLCHELCLRLYVSFFRVQSTHTFSKIACL